MSGPTVRVAVYRLRATLPRRWGGYLALTLLVGLVGGVALEIGRASCRERV